MYCATSTTCRADRAAQSFRPGRTRCHRCSGTSSYDVLGNEIDEQHDYGPDGVLDFHYTTARDEAGNPLVETDDGPHQDIADGVPEYTLSFDYSCFAW